MVAIFYKRFKFARLWGAYTKFSGERVGIDRRLIDGDIVEIDIPNRMLNVKLSDTELDKRLKGVKAPERKLTPLLVSYREKFTGSNCYGEKVDA